MEQTAPGIIETPTAPVTDTRDGITVTSNTGTADSLKAEVDGLDAALSAREEPARGDGGKFTAKEKRENPVARMNDATAKEAEAKRERDEARAENARLKADLEAARRPAQQPVAEPPKPQARAVEQPAEDAPPHPADAEKYPAGEYDPKYLEDRIDWGVRTGLSRAQQANDARQSRERQVSGVEAKMGDYSKRVGAEFPDVEARNAFLETLKPEIAALRPSYVEALLNKDFDPRAPLAPQHVIADQIIEFEKPAAALAYLNAHADFFQRLLTLHPIAIVREMGKLEERLSGSAAAPPTRTAPEPAVSKARPPVQRVESAPIVSDDPPGDDATDEQHVAYMNRKEAAARRGR